MTELIAISIFIFTIIFYGSFFLYNEFGWFKHFYHDFLERHKPTDECFSDELNTHGICKYCGKHIVRDSQGNWFEM